MIMQGMTQPGHHHRDLPTVAIETVYVDEVFMPNLLMKNNRTLVYLEPNT